MRGVGIQAPVDREGNVILDKCQRRSDGTFVGVGGVRWRLSVHVGVVQHSFHLVLISRLDYCRSALVRWQDDDRLVPLSLFQCLAFVRGDDVALGMTLSIGEDSRGL